MKDKVSTSEQSVGFNREGLASLRYEPGVYPILHDELCLPVELLPVCSPSLIKGAYALREPADLFILSFKICSLTHSATRRKVNNRKKVVVRLKSVLLKN